MGSERKGTRHKLIDLAGTLKTIYFRLIFLLQNATYTFFNLFPSKQNFENVSKNVSYSSYHHKYNLSLILRLETLFFYIYTEQGIG